MRLLPLAIAPVEGVYRLERTVGLHQAPAAGQGRIGREAAGIARDGAVASQSSNAPAIAAGAHCPRSGRRPVRSQPLHRDLAGRITRLRGRCGFHRSSHGRRSGHGRLRDGRLRDDGLSRCWIHAVRKIGDALGAAAPLGDDGIEAAAVVQALRRQGEPIGGRLVIGLPAQGCAGTSRAPCGSVPCCRSTSQAPGRALEKRCAITTGTIRPITCVSRRGGGSWLEESRRARPDRSSCSRARARATHRRRLRPLTRRLSARKVMA